MDGEPVYPGGAEIEEPGTAATGFSTRPCVTDVVGTPAALAPLGAGALDALGALGAGALDAAPPPIAE